jgi:hypothetical protein
MRRLRVLFVHGFESGPKGRRSVALGRHFECYTPWMREELEPILRWRRNRVVHACIALFLFLLALALYVHSAHALCFAFIVFLTSSLTHSLLFSCVCRTA